MKKIFIYLNLFLLFTSKQYAGYKEFGEYITTELTPIIAERLGYYNTIYQLRNKAQNYLENIEDAKDKFLQSLRNQSKFWLAEKKREILDPILRNHSSKIDKTFDKLSHEFVMSGDYYDDNNASIETKEDFIKKSMETAKKKINKLISLNLKDLKEKYKTIDY